MKKLRGFSSSLPVFGPITPAPIGGVLYTPRRNKFCSTTSLKRENNEKIEGNKTHDQMETLSINTCTPLIKPNAVLLQFESFIWNSYMDREGASAWT